MYTKVEGKKITKENNKQKNKTARMVRKRINLGRKEKKKQIKAEIHKIGNEVK